MNSLSSAPSLSTLLAATVALNPNPLSLLALPPATTIAVGKPFNIGEVINNPNQIAGLVNSTGNPADPASSGAVVMLIDPAKHTDGSWLQLSNLDTTAFISAKANQSVEDLLPAATFAALLFYSSNRLADDVLRPQLIKSARIGDAGFSLTAKPEASISTEKPAYDINFSQLAWNIPQPYLVGIVMFSADLILELPYSTSTTNTSYSATQNSVGYDPTLVTDGTTNGIAMQATLAPIENVELGYNLETQLPTTTAKFTFDVPSGLALTTTAQVTSEWTNAVPGAASGVALVSDKVPATNSAKFYRLAAPGLGK